MFGTLGMPELLLIFVIALLLFGPRKMPQIGKSVGRALGEFRRASNDFKRTIEDEVAAQDLRSVRRDLKDVDAVGRETADDLRKMTGTVSTTPDETPSPPESSTSPKDDGSTEAEEPKGP